MGRALIAAVLLLAGGCIPDFDRFRLPGEAVADGSVTLDAGPGVDAGPGADSGPGVDGGPPRDSGPGRDGGAGDTLLGRHADCATLMASVLFEETFETASPRFRLLSGSASSGGGQLTIEGGQDFVLLQSDSSFRNVVACATVRMQRVTGGAQLHELRLGLRGLMHGVSLNLVGSDGDVKLVSLEPETNVLVARQPLDWPEGDHTQRMLVFLEGDRLYGEVQDLSSGDVAVVFGRYGGVDGELNVNIEGSDLASTTYVERVVVGTPTADAGRVLRGE